MLNRHSFFSRILLSYLIVFLASCDQTTEPSTNTEMRLDTALRKQSGTTDLVELAITIHRINYLDEATWIDFVLTNHRDSVVRLDHRDEAGDIFLTLKDRYNQDVPGTDFARQEGVTGDPYEYTKNFGMRIGPHGLKRWRYNLRDYFKISVPGDYTLFIRRPFNSDSIDSALSGELDVGPIRIHFK